MYVKLQLALCGSPQTSPQFLRPLLISTWSSSPRQSVLSPTIHWQLYPNLTVKFHSKVNTETCRTWMRHIERFTTQSPLHSSYMTTSSFQSVIVFSCWQWTVLSLTRLVLFSNLHVFTRHRHRCVTINNFELWPSYPKVDRFMPLPCEPLVPICIIIGFICLQNIALTSLVTNERTDRQTDERMDGQLENIMPPPASVA